MSKVSKTENEALKNDESFLFLGTERRRAGEAYKQFDSKIKLNYNYLIKYYILFI